MPWASGTFSRTNGSNSGSTTWAQDRDAGVRITAPRHDTHDQDLADGINACLAKNGENAATDDLNLGGNKYTNAGDGTARDDLSTVGQIQDGDNVWADAGGTADAITATYSPAITTLVDGMELRVRAAAANATTTPTFSPNALTARTIVKNGGAALAAGDIAGDGHELLLRYDSDNTRWELLNPRGVTGAASSTDNAIPRFDGTGGKTFQGSGVTIDDNNLLTAPGGFAGNKGGDIASAGTLVIGTDGDFFDITGTTAVTAMTVAASRWFVLQFDAALTLTHGASLLLPGAANITTASGDRAVFYATAANTVICLSYTRAAGSVNTVTQGKHTIWMPAGAMRPTVSNGCADLATVETTAGRPDLQVLDFDASADEHAQFSIAFPKSWNNGTVSFQVFWTSAATDTDGVTWALQGVACADGDTADVAYGTAVTVNDANQSTAEDVYVTAESGAVTIAGSPGDSEIAFFRIFRDVSDANDTATEDARLIGVKLFYTIDAGNDE